MFRLTYRGLLAIVALALAFWAQYLFTGEIFTRTRDTNYRIWPPAALVITEVP